MKEDLIYISHILTAISDIKDFTAGMTKKDFLRIWTPALSETILSFSPEFQNAFVSQDLKLLADFGAAFMDAAL